MRGGWILFIVWSGLIVLLLTLGFTYTGDTNLFYGIADSREIAVSSESAVEIKRFLVVEGQLVTKGDKLVELADPELSMRISALSGQREQLKAENGMSREEIKAKINTLVAERAALESERQSQIANLEDEYRLNRELSSNLKSIQRPKTEQGATRSPLATQIEGMKRDLKLLLNAKDVEISQLRRLLNTSGGTFELKGEQLAKELAVLEEKNRSLEISAQIDGIIGSVNFKAGEKVSPFQPIMTLHTKTPSLVKGYVHENRHSSIVIGEKTKVSSLADKTRSVEGTVVGVGARIVEMPVRLRRHPELSLWGREVVIRLPDENPFILGEKVLISAEAQVQSGLFSKLFSLMFSEVRAANASSVKAGEGDLASSILPVSSVPWLELSGALYLPERREYLLVSDETPHKKPLIIRMDASGERTALLSVSGADKFNDLESIAIDASGAIYLLSSLSVNKENELKVERKKIWKINSVQDGYAVTASCDMYAAFSQVAAQAPKLPWARAVAAGIAEKTLDIEAMTIVDSSLLVGLKNPLDTHGSVIIRIQGADNFFKTCTLDVSAVTLDRIVSLNDDSGEKEHLSDLLSDGRRLFALSSHKNGGSLWEITTTPRLIRRFQGHTPEALSRSHKKGMLFVGFDDKTSSSYTFVPHEVAP